MIMSLQICMESFQCMIHFIVSFSWGRRPPRPRGPGGNAQESLYNVIALCYVSCLEILLSYCANCCSICCCVSKDPGEV